MIRAVAGELLGTSTKKAKAPGKELSTVEFYEFDAAVDASINAMETRMIQAEGGISNPNVLNQRNAPKN